MSIRIYLATIVAIFCSVLIVLVLTSAVIDPYIKATNWGVNLFEFYEKNKEPNKIYFIGDSLTATGVDPVIIENSLLSNNLSFNVYNLAYPLDLPLNRVAELTRIAESKPKIVVIDFSESWLMPWPDFLASDQNQTNGYAEIRFLLASDKINLDPYVQSLFNKTELDSIKTDRLHLLVHKRRFLIPGVQLALSNTGLIKYKPEKSWCDLFDFKNQITASNESVKLFNNTYCELSEDDNRNRQCFRYIIDYLKERGIKVILVNMPLCPYWHKCTSDSKIVEDFVKMTGCPYYDLGSLCTAGEFQDIIHVNYAGRRNITRRMTEILSSEAINVTE